MQIVMAASATDIIGPLHIGEMVWIGASTNDHLVLTINGIAITYTCNTAVYGAEMHLLKQPLGRIDTLAITTIDAGTLYIFVQ